MTHAPVAQRPARRRLGWLLPILALTSALLAAGCIRSQVMLDSDPQGAEVIWRGQPYGATPVTIPFTWYWQYDVVLEKPGYDRVEATEHFRTPPWFLMPLDLVMEVLPIPIHDTRERFYVLNPTQKTQYEPPVQEISPALPELR